jgi:hypothetical protein
MLPSTPASTARQSISARRFGSPSARARSASGYPGLNSCSLDGWRNARRADRHPCTGRTARARPQLVRGDASPGDAAAHPCRARSSTGSGGGSAVPSRSRPMAQSWRSWSCAARHRRVAQERPRRWRSRSASRARRTGTTSARHSQRAARDLSNRGRNRGAPPPPIRLTSRRGADARSRRSSAPFAMKSG